MAKAPHDRGPANRPGVKLALVLELADRAELYRAKIDIERVSLPRCLQWSCTMCHSVRVSDRYKSHSPDICACGAASVDAEADYTLVTGVRVAWKSPVQMYSVSPVDEFGDAIPYQADEYGQS